MPVRRTPKPSLADIVAKGGNLLLNVGPRGDGVVPDDQQLRLDWLGEWLDVAGPALRATRPWVRSEDTAPDGTRLRFTARGADVHVIVLDVPARTATVPGVTPGPTGGVRRSDGTAVQHELTPQRTKVTLGDTGSVGPTPLVLTITNATAAPPN